MLGVDLVVPDVTYLVNNREKIKGVILTHGHEDHIGGVPYLLQRINVPVYGTRLTLGILENKFKEFRFDFKPELHCVSAGERIKLGIFDVEFIHVNHSIAGAVCVAIRTPVGTVVHSGDFKIDATPVDGEMTDLTRLGEIGKEGVTQSACCACSGTKSQLGSGIASLFGLPGKGTQLTVERRYLLGGGALLRSKDIGCAILAIQRIVNVASYYYPAFHVKASFGSHGFYHAASAIACGTSAYAHHYRLAASLHGICHHLNHT